MFGSGSLFGIWGFEFLCRVSDGFPWMEEYMGNSKGFTFSFFCLALKRGALSFFPAGWGWWVDLLLLGVRWFRVRKGGWGVGMGVVLGVWGVIVLKVGSEAMWVGEGQRYCMWL